MKESQGRQAGIEDRTRRTGPLSSSKLQNGHSEAQEIQQRQPEAFVDEQDAPDKTEIEQVSKGGTKDRLPKEKIDIWLMCAEKELGSSSSPLGLYRV